MRFVPVVAVAVISLAPACAMKEQMQHAHEDAEKARTQIRHEVGVDAFVSFRVFYGTGGSRLDVQVSFKQTPPGIAADVKEQVTEIVKRNFRDPVTSVTVSM